MKPTNNDEYLIFGKDQHMALSLNLKKKYIVTTEMKMILDDNYSYQIDPILIGNYLYVIGMKHIHKIGMIGR